MIVNIWVKYMKKNTKKLEKIVITLLFIIIIAIGLYFNPETEKEGENAVNSSGISYEISDIPEYDGKIYIEINNNMPKFTDEDILIEEDCYSLVENEKARNGNGKNQLGKS